MPDHCPVCGDNKCRKIHVAREMMFGTRDRFEYCECGQCGTLRLVNVPDLKDYYPKDYYSLQTGRSHFFAPIRRRIAARLIGKHLFSGRGKFGGVLSRRRTSITDRFPAWLRYLPASIDFNSSVLDYGCGNGDLLRTLSAFGFRNLTGADPFVDKDLHFPSVNVYRKSLTDLNEAFDLIMLHHSFEHLPDPEASLQQIDRLLSIGGTVLIRIPIVSYAWEKYGINWVQLDPPRHLFLYTEHAFRALAQKLGFTVNTVVYDSEAFQFYGSEQYGLDIPMNDPQSFRGVSETSIFTQNQMDEWTRLAAELNLEGRGDQACFYLERSIEVRNE